jgi:hypothetical protein
MRSIGGVIPADAPNQVETGHSDKLYRSILLVLSQTYGAAQSFSGLGQKHSGKHSVTAVATTESNSSKSREF